MDKATASYEAYLKSFFEMYDYALPDTREIREMYIHAYSSGWENAVASHEETAVSCLSEEREDSGILDLSDVSFEEDGCGYA
jgi:hypothetical protein